MVIWPEMGAVNAKTSTSLAWWMFPAWVAAPKASSTSGIALLIVNT
jgi:hypothetical protein